MSLCTAPQVPNIPEGSTEVGYISWNNVLKSGETISSATVEEDTTSDLTIENVIPTAGEEEINNETVAAGRAIQYDITGMLAATKRYKLNIEITTSAGRVRPGWAHFTSRSE